MPGHDLHDKLTIVDGLIFMADETGVPLRRGGVAAANVTVCGFQADFAEACDDLARWHGTLSRPDSAWYHIRTVDDIDLARKAKKVGLIMGFQNIRPIADKIERLAFFHAAGVRIMQLTYNERNFVGDGCLEEEQAGLSSFGKRVVSEMNRLGIAVDISHVGERTCLDVLECSTVPALVTHANSKAVADVPRNKSDSLLKEIVANGGTIGVSIHGFLCWGGDPKQPHTLGNFVRHINYVRDLVGIRNIALGTDFHSLADGSRATNALVATRSRYASIADAFVTAFGGSLEARYPADCNSPAELYRLTDALLAEGWTENALRAFYGENLMRVLRKVWK